MEKNQGFFTSFNFPVKKSARRDQPNVLGLRRKINADDVLNIGPQLPQHLVDTPSDIQHKTDKAQIVTPQSKARLSNKMNKILETNSSKSKDKVSDTVVGSYDADPQKQGTGSKSLTFPEPFSIPKPQTEPKSALPDTELFTDDEDEVEKHIKPEVLSPLPRNARDTIEGNTEDIERGYRNANQSESEEEIIDILDSDEENSINMAQPPVQAKSFYNCSRGSSATVDKFFDYPPSLKDSELAVRHSDIHRFKSQFGRQQEIQPPIPMIRENFGEEDVSMLSVSRVRRINEDTSMLSVEQGRAKQINESYLSVDRDKAANEDLEDIEIGPTDESNNNVDDDVIDLTINQSPSPPPQRRANPARSSEVVLSSNTPNTIKAQISTPRSGKKNVTEIQIKFDLKISIRDGSASSSESEKSSPPSSPRRLTETSSMPTSNSKNKSVHRNKQAGTPNTMVPMIKASEEPKTPEKEEIMIDEDLQKLLSDLYGDTWKTPQLLKSCKSKRVRESLRKSLHANNFESFVRHLPSDLESTRVTVGDSDDRRKSDEEEQFRKPMAPVSGKKATPKVVKKTPKPRTKSASSESDVPSTPKSQKSIPRSASKVTPSATPKYLEICDPDTSSEEASDDEDFNPNDTWNASSDEDYESESERIKKRNTVRQSMRFEELTFVRDESIVEQKKLEQLLEKYEYTKPPQIDDTKKKSKRKLFTHSHYEEEEEIETISKVDEKENEIPKDFKWPSPPRKEVKKPEVPTPVRKTPSKTKIVTTKATPLELQKRFGPLSFLKSLDAEANRSLCDPDAIYYRNNYKTKKHELAEKLFKLYNEKVFNLQLTNVPMKWNKKLLNTAGRCNNSRRNGVRQSSLELSDKVLTSADRLRCTLIHEMCHAASWMIEGENGHGVVWKRWAARANSTFPELPKISVCHDYVIEYKYTYLCINCKAQSKAHSKSKKVEEIQCSICKGSIKLFENKKNNAGEIQMVPVEKKEVTGFAKFVKLQFKEVKRPNMTHKEVMQILSTKFQSMTVEEKSNL